METPHPHHVTHKKKWTEYLLEFFMLFLAVFLGFVAENIRENIAEQRREKEYIRSMVEDLRSDTANINSFELSADVAINDIDSLIHLLRRSDRSNYGQTMYFFARFITTKIGRFVLNDRTFEEMKGSGSLRLIKDEALSDSISRYYSEQNRFKEQEQLQLQKLAAYTDHVGRLFDGAIFQQMLQRFPYKVIHPTGNPQLLTNDVGIINETIGYLHYYSAVIIINASLARQKEDASIRLIKGVQEKYNLKKE